MERAIDRVLFAFAKEMRERCHFECWSIGGKTNNFLEEIGAKFVVLRRTMQEDARKIALSTIDRLLHIINNDEELRPYLIEYPFPSHRLKIRICFRKSNHCSYSDGSMESVTLEGDEMTYFQEAPPHTDPYPSTPPVFAKENYFDLISL